MYELVGQASPPVRPCHSCGGRNPYTLDTVHLLRKVPADFRRYGSANYIIKNFKN